MRTTFALDVNINCTWIVFASYEYNSTKLYTRRVFFNYFFFLCVKTFSRVTTVILFSSGYIREEFQLLARLIRLRSYTNGTQRIRQNIIEKTFDYPYRNNIPFFVDTFSVRVDDNSGNRLIFHDVFADLMRGRIFSFLHMIKCKYDFFRYIKKMSTSSSSLSEENMNGILFVQHS